MKVERQEDEKFIPVVITLETQEEVNDFVKMIGEGLGMYDLWKAVKRYAEAQ